MMAFLALLSALLSICSSQVHADINGVDLAFEKLVIQLIQDGQDSTYIVQLFQRENVRFIEDLVVRNMIPQDNPEDYTSFLTRDQIEDGFQFLNNWKRELEKALDGSDVPIEISVAILKVESNFGRYSGDMPVLSVLATLGSIDEPQYWIHIADTSSTLSVKRLSQRAHTRSKWAYRELLSFIKACEQQGWDPDKIKGSWAGAFGLAQFLPSSYLHYGRDGDGDQVVDPNNLYDAVASMAWYLKKAGWGKSDRSWRKAILRYNPSSAYADCILDYAKQLKNMAESSTLTNP